MLSALHIENYALIDTLDIELPEGLTIVTGETGAGKSIILGALGLLMGAKADTKQLRDPQKRIVVEAEFQMVGREALRNILLSDGADEEEITELETAMETDGALILRRDVSPAGRSRAYINEASTTLKRVSAIATQLIDIHSQRSNTLMDNREFRLAILDSIAGNQHLLSAYRNSFEEYASLRRKVQRQRKELEEGRQQQELIAMKLERLRELKPRAGEQKELERRVEILSAAEEIRSSLQRVCRLLDGDESSVLASLHEASVELAQVNPSIFNDTDADGASSLKNRLCTAAIELRDITESLQGYYEEVEANPALLQQSEVRLEAIYAEEKRFGVDSDEKLSRIKEELEASVAALADGDNVISELEIKAKKAARALKDAAAALTESRARAAAHFSTALHHQALQLGLPNLAFEARVEPALRMSPDGADNPLFLCAFNKNQPLRPLSEIASGGEMSRLMLCVKFIVAGHMQMPTIIFDEVDTGVSGDIADKMGRMMRTMAAGLQVIAITHLPQVAVMGNLHLKVYKEDSSDATFTHITSLEADDRVVEIARMLSGSEIDEAALLNARSLLNKINR